MVLSASGAVEASADREPVLHNIVEELCLASGMPKPSLYIIESSAPNAFATGRDPATASVAVTRGLLQKLSREELQGVLAHEMSHVRNLDMRFATIVGILVGTVALLCDWGWRSWRFRGGRRSSGSAGLVIVLLALVLAIFAPLASRLIQMAISRRRELLADASAVELTRNPGGLAAALRTIAADPAGLEVANRATQHLFIVNPLKSYGIDSSALLSTHPPIEARIRILESMM
jgi:heat shock protein HtpX